jgi:hypothetical protein
VVFAHDDIGNVRAWLQTAAGSSGARLEATCVRSGGLGEHGERRVVYGE